MWGGYQGLNSNDFMWSCPERWQPSVIGAVSQVLIHWLFNRWRSLQNKAPVLLRCQDLPPASPGKTVQLSFPCHVPCSLELQSAGAFYLYFNK